VIGVLGLLLIVVLAALLLLTRRCTHCRRPRAWGLLQVTDYLELSRCAGCRAVARDRKRVQLCPACYRSHVLQGAPETVAAR
jgi:hypothetical protein